ncbi:hypothetical protein [Clostridium saccharobutylicum]|nr:hypothetical protein [Clostridium saccharobutylicum]AQR91563.1 hypothetical protein CLOSC_32890 [Clostridium saccharobutylicum]AQS01468.1 hypothetical protein CSACC_32970 [Clostridium saccharobutylicum]AQS11077.1 hypothetical protein CLOBY_32270 [Clostridium saccharobutylicum]AQS15451.1 hypothetical protein CLOSACC_32970 [Clostridium saccharobutylicum]MBA2907418.1 small nuclear ribonucleoprotein (snRNP)-like protein [Clostridium saccharobutylicum]
MEFEKNDYYRDLESVQDECKKYLYYHVILTMTDGNIFDGIIEDVDGNNITVLSGEDVMEPENETESNQQRQYNPYGYNYGYNYGYPRRRYRRFRRRTFPLATLAAFSLLPYIAPPTYPYYPY